MFNTKFEEDPKFVHHMAKLSNQYNKYKGYYQFPSNYEGIFKKKQ